MNKMIGKILAAAVISVGFVGGAQADVADRTISANAAPEVLFKQIVETATSMCNEAAGQGEVFNVAQCVNVVVSRTVAELNRPNLTAYALMARPALASI